ncbi:MAG: Hsp33 family molecular chaperone HslO [Erysipelotrichaceae bacterium]|nr:Hsp33 family molecular chaperone HslO [Erysipelotrichaceae bacterium]
MADILSRGTALNGNIRVFCCRTTDLVQEAKERHDLWPTAAAALGRTLSIGCIMGCMLKTNREKIEIQIKGGGPIGEIVVDAYNNGKVRGYCGNPHVHKEKDDNPLKLDVGYAVGNNGTLKVVKDMSMKQPFVSEVEIQSGEIGEDFAYYYTLSEQTPSAVSVGVLVNTDLNVKAAGALVIQMLPSATEEDIQAVEKVVANMKPISTLIDEGGEPKDIISGFFPDYEELEEQPLRFKCECSKGRFAMVLAKLPIEDLQTMVDEDHGCEVVCRFCGNKYTYQQETLEGYIRAAKERASEKTDA